MTVVIFALCGLYKSLWAYAGEREMIQITVATFTVSLVQTVAQFVTGLTVPRNYALIQFFLLLFLVLGIRFSYRFLRYRRSLHQNKFHNKCRTMIVGAGEAAATTLRELQRSRFSQNNVVCLVDDDPQKAGKNMYGVPVAVNPTNVMGTTKRICEMVIQCRRDSSTTFAAVRFGNVLGSNGSVIPLFKKQIAEGGPVTITDKRIIRYFMTLSEASQLVMEAGAMAKKGELFVLDMGSPVRIYDLAVNMIKLSGLEPDVDIEIKETGLRPGEKLYEELLMKSELLDKTKNELIFIERDTPLTRAEVDQKLSILTRAVKDDDCEIALTRIKNAIKQTVPTFHEPEEVNNSADAAEEMKQSSLRSTDANARLQVQSQ